jgi:hypothetical protein
MENKPEGVRGRERPELRWMDACLGYEDLRKSEIKGCSWSLEVASHGGGS